MANLKIIFSKEEIEKLIILELRSQWPGQVWEEAEILFENRDGVKDEIVEVTVTL